MATRVGRQIKGAKMEDLRRIDVFAGEHAELRIALSKIRTLEEKKYTHALSYGW